MKLSVYIFVFIFIFSGCEDKEPVQHTKKDSVNKIAKKTIEKQKKQSVDYMVKKVKKIKKTKDVVQNLSKTIEDEGVIVDGGYDKDLLDAFGKAVSRVIIEDGIDVPDCNSISKTGYLTLEECNDISLKYFNYYNPDGIENNAGLLQEGVLGDDVEIGTDSTATQYEKTAVISSFKNEDELVEFVDNSSNFQILEELSSNLEEDVSEEIKEKIEQKIEYLKEEQAVQSASAQATPQNIASDLSNENYYIDTSDETESGLSISELNSNLISYKNSLSNLEQSHEKTKIQMDNNPDDESLIEQYNKELGSITFYENKISQIQSQIDALSN
jgi:NCAIR mutase (PurE)-related protein